MDDDEPMLLADNDDVIISQPGMHPPPPAYSQSQSHQHPYDVGGVALGNMVAGGSSSHSAQHTTIVINQPGQLTHMGPRDWTSSLCSCCDDMGSCILGAFCPCILACQITSDMGESSCVPCCVPGWLIVLRSKLRTQHNIQGTVMDDCCVTVCCGNCVMCQMARELKYISTFSRPYM
ncbi:placenta-specific gene 8 protein-like [Littorina saxatilis]|uniref:Uncharacterized protein n=1 Tax=Littorina saxatilis TaxID=31220 RepID=A0AAN9G7X8_9CAEN